MRVESRVRATGFAPDGARWVVSYLEARRKGQKDSYQVARAEDNMYTNIELYTTEREAMASLRSKVTGEDIEAAQVKLVTGSAAH